jgi:hypothetical protein
MLLAQAATASRVNHLNQLFQLHQLLQTSNQVKHKVIPRLIQLATYLEVLISEDLPIGKSSLRP